MDYFLPKLCNCGQQKGQPCKEKGLKNHHNFSPFGYLPDENEIDTNYLRATKIGVYVPFRHWALIGDITNVCNYFIRHRVQIQTRFGESIPLAFHLEGSCTPTYFE